MEDLRSMDCTHRSGEADRISPEAAAGYLGRLDGWTPVDGGRAIERSFAFANFHETMAFVNAVAWIAHRQDHHPDLTVGYSRVTVRFGTHSVGGLSLNDFICAARVDALL